ncbi:MAG TPA: DUF6249 domain-containing protein [Candidatus Dormibacteraeota bacterium]|nr:DUF6249 domain-containing protein [Candidatus Dormibacteraeota bacterium]
MDSDSTIALVAVVCVIALPIVAVILFRVFSHRERMEMIRHGYVPPVQYDGNLQLRRGISVTFIGIALTIGLAFIGYNGDGFGGRFVLGPWLLGGIIPTFVGIAQIVGSLVAGGRPASGRSGTPFGPYGMERRDPSPYEPHESESPKRPPV